MPHKCWELTSKIWSASELKDMLQKNINWTKHSDLRAFNRSFNETWITMWKFSAYLETWAFNFLSMEMIRNKKKLYIFSVSTTGP